MQRIGRLGMVLAAAVLLCCSGAGAERRSRAPDATVLDRLVDQKLYPELHRQISNAKLSPLERTYFTGILEDREHKVPEAIAKLEKALPELAKSNRHRAAIALRALAQDYFEAGRYADSADAYALLLKSYRDQFTPAENENFSDDQRSYELIRDAAPQQVTGNLAFTVPAQSDPIADIDVPVKVGAAEMWWIFDTGANITTISQSTARRLGLKLSARTASTKSGATGAEVPLHMAIIPELHFGGAVVRNVVAQVMDDKELDVDLGKNGHYSIAGILGYPVLARLGSFRFAGNQVTAAPQGDASPRCTPMYVEDLTPMVAARVHGRELVFTFDTGANKATFTAKYFHAFRGDFAKVKPIRVGAGGAGGVRYVTAYPLPPTRFHLGAASLTMQDLPVYSEKLGTGLLDEAYGNVGQALVAPFKSYTIDFNRMQLCVGVPAIGSSR